MNSLKVESDENANETKSKKSLKSSSVKIPSSILWNLQYKSIALLKAPIYDLFRYEPISLVIYIYPFCSTSNMLNKSSTMA